MKIAVVLLLLGLPILLQAEEQGQLDQHPPTGPLLNRTVAPAEWSITITIDASTTKKTVDGTPTTGASGKEANQAKNQLMQVIKDQNLFFEKTYTAHGEVIESWHAGNWVVSKFNDKNWNVASGEGNGNTFNYADYTKSDFAGFGWITLNNFSGRRIVMGKKCLIFKDKVITIDPQELETDKGGMATKDNPNPSDDLFKVDVEADIDDATRLPIMLIYQTPLGKATRTYTFKTPEASLSLPPEVKQLLDKYNLYIKRMSARVAPI